MILVKPRQGFDCNLQKAQLKKLQTVKNFQIFLGDPKSMTNYLSFETNLSVLAQFDKKWHTIKDSYSEVQ